MPTLVNDIPKVLGGIGLVHLMGRAVLWFVRDCKVTLFLRSTRIRGHQARHLGSIFFLQTEEERASEAVIRSGFLSS